MVEGIYSMKTVNCMRKLVSMVEEDDKVRRQVGDILGYNDITISIEECEKENSWILGVCSMGKVVKRYKTIVSKRSFILKYIGAIAECIEFNRRMLDAVRLLLDELVVKFEYKCKVECKGMAQGVCTEIRFQCKTPVRITYNNYIMSLSRNPDYAYRKEIVIWNKAGEVKGKDIIG